MAGIFRILAAALALLAVATALIVTGHWVFALGAVTAGAVAIVGTVWKRWQDRIATHIDDRLRRLISRFDRRYRASLLSKVRFIDLKGLITVGSYHPKLDEVFVDLSLAHRAPSQVSDSVLAQLPANVTDRRPIWESLDDPEPKILAIVGAPGSGKTTLLRHVVWQLCHGARPTVPVLLFLRDHVRAIVSRPEVTLLDLLRTTLGPLADDEPPGWFDQRLRGGDCVVLLDGLDEVGLPEDRQHVHDWVERQIRHYPNNDYVITFRPHGYEHIEGAEVHQVHSFTRDQVESFVRRWYLAVETHEARRGVTKGADRPAGDRSEAAIRQDAGEQSADLLERLNGAPALLDLTVNPLLLTMIATVHRWRGALPGNRTDLYNEICQVLLWRQPEARRVSGKLPGRKQEVLLRRLAFMMMRRRVHVLPAKDILAELDGTRRRMSIEAATPDLLTDIRRHGLLQENESGLYSFAHHTFQEFLAAAHIRDKELSEVLVESVDDTWWRETTLLYAAMADADPIMRACLGSGGETALSLALDCADECRELDPELRARLDEWRDSVRTSSRGTSAARAMVHAMISRHLHPVIRTSDDSGVCARPITAGIFRLYRQDTDGAAVLTPGSAEDEPVTGVRSSDAAAFVEWVNDVTDGKPGYRLPTRAELDDPGVHHALVMTSRCSAWTRPGDGRDEPSLWATGGTSHPHAVDAKTLAAHVRDDIAGSMPTSLRILLVRSVVAVHCLEGARRVVYVKRDLYNDAFERTIDRDPTVTHMELRNLADELLTAQDGVAEIAKDLRRTVGMTASLGPAIPLDPDRATALATALTHAIQLADQLQNELIRATDEIASTCERRLRKALGRAMRVTETNDSSLTAVLPVGLDRVRTLAADVDYAHALDQVLGRALRQAVPSALHRGSADTWPARLSTALVDVAGAGDATFVVSPDDLADHVRECGAVMRDPTRSWAGALVEALHDTALPVFTWHQPLTETSAATIRLAALCLAAEADAREDDRLATTLREVAAGVTFLQQRAAGGGPTTETIFLATRVPPASR